MTEWRAIDSAPRDEERILLFYPEVEGVPCDGIIEGWYFSSPKGLDDGWETIIGFIGEPTHWMPLPEPPLESSNDRKEG